jgi:Protein of unknown function (DUF4199)
MLFTRTFIKWGIIAGLLSAIYLFIIFRMGLYSNRYAPYFTLIFLALCIFLAIREFKKKRGGLSYVQGMGMGLLTGLVAGLFKATWYYIYVDKLNRALLYQSYNSVKQRNELRSEGLSEEQIDETIKLMAQWVPVHIQSLVILAVDLTAAFLFTFIITIVIKNLRQKQATGAITPSNL